MNITPAQFNARSFYFGQFVADYFAAYGFYPTMREMRVGWLYSTRKANRH